MRDAVGTFFVRVGLRLRGRGRPVTRDRGLSRDETWALLDERARRLLGISADEFERRLIAGELEDTSTVRSLSFLVGADPARQ